MNLTMKILQTLWRDNKASVLMEAILVMPLYLLLFGGMMLCGDVALGGGKLLSANRFLAWTAKDRIIDATRDGDILQYAKSFFSNEIWQYSSQLTENEYALYYESSSGDRVSNWWSHLLSSSIPLELQNVPPLYKGMIVANEIMLQGDKEVPLSQRNFLLSQKKQFSHYVLKTSNISSNQKASRDLHGQQLAQSMRWLEIAHDTWISKETTTMVTINQSANTPAVDDGYIRYLEIYGGDR